MNAVLARIYELCDPKYKEFHQRLIPSVESERVLGLRSPDAMKIAKEFTGTKEGELFLGEGGHKYYDENVVHAFMLGRLKEDFDSKKERILSFLPFVNNWAVCDGLVSHLKAFFSDKEKAFPFVLECIKSETVYTVRFGLVALTDYYICPLYIDRILEIALNIKSEEYYINMALAWLLSICLVKDYEKTLPFFEKNLLPKWVHNKSIQKATESYRICREKKEHLRSLKIK